MSSNPLKHLTRITLSENKHFTRKLYLHKEPDQTVALVGCAMVEFALERAIAARLKRMEQNKYDWIFGGGPLRGFPNKIKMGYALSVFGEETCDELDRIQAIRNVFAHAMHNVSFSTPEIAEYCKTLMTCDKNCPTFVSHVKKNPADPKERYVLTCNTLEYIFGTAAEFYEGNRPKRPLSNRAFLT